MSTAENKKEQKSIEHKKIRAFIFDMDGTLLDTTMMDYKAWVQLFGEYGESFMSYEEYKSILGIKSDDVIRKRLGLEGEDLKRALKKRLQLIEELLETDELRTIPFAEEFLRSVRAAGFMTALATGARREKLEAVMRKVDLKEHFDVIVTSNDVEKGKPDPALFLEAARRLGIEPSQAVVFEDAENGVAAAKRAGMKCVAITTTTSEEKLRDADLVIGYYTYINASDLAERLSH